MAEPFLDTLKNVVPSLEKAIEVDFLLLLTSFVMLADCAARYVHAMNILHLSQVPDVIKPRLAIEAVFLVIGFGFFVGVLIPFVLVTFVNPMGQLLGGSLWDRLERLFDPDVNLRITRRPDPDCVSVHELRKKAHESKESYYLNLLKQADDEANEEIEHRDKRRQTASYAFSVLVLCGVDLFAPLSLGNGILSQILDGLGRTGLGFLGFLGLFLVVLTFYPVYEDLRGPGYAPGQSRLGRMPYCPELARELDKKRQEERRRLPVGRPLSGKMGPNETPVRR